MNYQPYSAFNAYFSRSQRPRPFYVSCVQIYNWAITKHAEGEGSTYYDAIDLWNSAMKEIEDLFNGTKTYIDPISGATIYLPKLCEVGDISDMYLDNFNDRIVAWPLFSSMYLPDNDNDERWYSVLKHFCDRIKRFVHTHGLAVYKSLGTLAIQYNPVADFWRKGVDITAVAPFISLTNPAEGEGEEPTISDWNSDSSHTDGYQSHSTIDNGTETRNYTSTYDDAANGRLAGYQTQAGGTTNSTTMPNTGSVKKYSEEGNKG